MKHRPNLTRRNFATGAAASMLGVNVLPSLYGNSLAAAQTASTPTNGNGVSGKAKQVIYLFLRGGMSHLDTLDPKPGQTDIMGDTKVIDTNVDGIQFGHWLEKCATHADKMSIFRSVTSTQGAHDPGQYFVRTNYQPNATIEHPAMGAWMSVALGESPGVLPRQVVVGGGSKHPGAGFFDTSHEPLPIGDPTLGLQNIRTPGEISESEFQDRIDLLGRFNRPFEERYTQRGIEAYSQMYGEAIRLMKSEEVSAFDLNHEPDSLRDRYGRNSFGQGCLLARRLIENGVRYIEVGDDGWDNHNDIYSSDRLPLRTSVLDNALSTLLEDLQQRGLLDTTLVVLVTEFGRSPRLSAGNGRSHHPKCFSTLLAGGGVKGGFVYGASDEHGNSAEENPISIKDFNATVHAAMGISPELVLFSPTKRPFKPAGGGKAVTEVLT